MNALDTLIELSGQMELEHAEESRGSPFVVREEPAKPACFTPKEKRCCFHPSCPAPQRKRNQIIERPCFRLPASGIVFIVHSAQVRDFRRATFKPQEFAEMFMKMHQSSMAEGIFLSSGIAAGGANTQNRILGYCRNFAQETWLQRLPAFKDHAGRGEGTGAKTDAIGRSCLHQFGSTQ